MLDMEMFVSYSDPELQVEYAPIHMTVWSNSILGWAGVIAGRLFF